MLQPGPDKAVVFVKDPLAALAGFSANFYGHPDKSLHMIGVTGTNGKTTITYLLESIFETHNLATGVMGTINYRFGKKAYPAPNTTPQSSDIYQFFAEMLKGHGRVAVMEVSSHALALGRVAGIEFDTAIFTNLTRDHLDFHKTMEEYFEAKAKLFLGLVHGEKSFPKFAIINIDDPWGAKLAAMSQPGTVVTYGLSEKAAIRAVNIRNTSRSTEFILSTPAGHQKVHLSQIGLHNVYNALAAAGAALASGISLEGVVSGLENAPCVPGRLEKIEAGQNFAVVVDYAHTDDALKNVLTALKELKPQRLITVFGCGGDRDRSKRPIMGEIASNLSDFVFVTSDNPRSEDMERIALDIEVGIRRQHRNNYQVILDREQAIAAALSMAQKGDIVLIAGKGHETYQIIGDQRLHFNDGEIARKYLQSS
jgi:UDP-N-acetylmuramoyl-L-alanyl-D-glutamate--2,6-diaminopimelate ligase